MGPGLMENSCNITLKSLTRNECDIFPEKKKSKISNSKEMDRKI